MNPMKNKKLTDRIESYIEKIEGECSCGEKVNMHIGSNCPPFTNGNRYYYPGSETAMCIFRCRGCRNPIDETFNLKKITEIITIKKVKNA